MMISNSKRRAPTRNEHDDDGAPSSAAAAQKEKKAKLVTSKERSLASALFGAAAQRQEENDDDNDNDVDDKLATARADDAAIDATLARLRADLDQPIDDENDNDDNDDDDENDRESESDGAADAAEPADAAEQTMAASVWHDEDDDDDAARVVDVRLPDAAAAAAAEKLDLRKSLAEKKITRADYARRLRDSFVKLQPHKTAWAQLKPDAERGDGDDDDDDVANVIARSAKPLVEARRDANQARITQLRDANAQDPSKAAVQAVDFHASGALLLTAGFDKALRLFRCDGRVNEKLRSVFFDDFPIQSAFFVPHADEVVCTSRRSHMHVFNMTTGATTRFVPRLGTRVQKSLERALPSPDGSRIAVLGTSGFIDLLSARTKQWQAALKMNGLVDAVVFANDGRRLYSGGNEGVIYEWDLRTMATVDRWRVDGALQISALALAPGGGTLAVGDDSGVVKLFDLRRGAVAAAAAASIGDDEQWLLDDSDKRLHADREITNLTTTITSLQYSHDGSVLALASNRRKQALRLYNTVDRCVYANWPAPRDRVGYVTSFAFSPANSLFAVGSLKGTAQLFRKLE